MFAKNAHFKVEVNRWLSLLNLAPLCILLATSILPSRFSMQDCCFGYLLLPFIILLRMPVMSLYLRWFPDIIKIEFAHFCTLFSYLHMMYSDGWKSNGTTELEIQKPYARREKIPLFSTSSIRFHTSIAHLGSNKLLLLNSKQREKSF